MPTEKGPGGGDGIGGVVHLSAEYWPYAQTGGLAEAVQSLSTYQARAGVSTAAILPFYGRLRGYYPDIEPWGEPFTVQVGDRKEPARLLCDAPDDGEPHVFFIENEEHFGRAGIYGEGGADYPDNFRRFGFFSMAALESLGRLPFETTLLHTHDWHTALAGVYLRTHFQGDPGFDGIATVLSVHNAGYQGHAGHGVLAELGLPEELYTFDKMEWYDQVNILKGGVAFADYVTTVSPTHAHELRTKDGGFGLHDTFTALQDRLVGILNGIDQDIWDPETDPHIEARYSVGELGGKAECKRWLQENSGLEAAPDVPLFAMSARMVKQKGLDLILGAEILLEADAQFVFLGQGEDHYQRALSELAARAPERIVTRFDFTHRRERQLLAGADALLMPSLYEPCGLTQMRAQRYGALPVARRVGGLADTVEDQVTGFLFDEYEPEALSVAVRRAIDLYQDQHAWRSHVHAAMGKDFGWARSAEAYVRVYRSALARRARTT